MKKTIHVAVGIVVNDEKKILIAKRPEDSHQGGLWEFPGGKVEKNESTFDALVREFREEVDINIQEASPFIKINHDYIDKSVVLDVWQSEKFTGDAKGLEGQEVKWISFLELSNYSFPEANKTIILKLKEAQAGIKSSNL